MRKVVSSSVGGLEALLSPSWWRVRDYELLGRGAEGSGLRHRRQEPEAGRQVLPDHAPRRRVMHVYARAHFI